MQRPLISQTQTRDGALGEGPGSERFSMYMNRQMALPVQSIYKFQQNAYETLE